jgi:hypothetical protein
VAVALVSDAHQWRLRMGLLRSPRRVRAFLNSQFQCLFDIALPLSRICSSCSSLRLTNGDYAQRHPLSPKVGTPSIDQCQCLFRTGLTSLGDGRAGRDSDGLTDYSHVT